jgi:hypothetical protein
MHSPACERSVSRVHHVASRYNDVLGQRRQRFLLGSICRAKYQPRSRPFGFPLLNDSLAHRMPLSFGWPEAPRLGLATTARLGKDGCVHFSEESRRQAVIRLKKTLTKSLSEYVTIRPIQRNPCPRPQHFDRLKSGIYSPSRLQHRAILSAIVLFSC